MESIYYSETNDMLITVSLFRGRIVLETEHYTHYNHTLKSGIQFLINNSFELIGYL